jgi:glycerophosphoryl diester phosphodiesterase
MGLPDSLPVRYEFAMSLDGAKILVHGHRGARWVLPENTLPAFEYAIKVGADVLELDLAVTKDNVLVVSHDPIINTAICSGEHAGKVIRTLTLAQVKEVDCGAKANPEYSEQKAVPGTRIPTLDEVLSLGRRHPKVWFNIETKLSAKHPEQTPPPDEYARLILDAVRKHKLEDRVYVQSFDFRTLHAMRKLEPKIPLAALYIGPARDLVDIAREAGTNIVAPHYSLITKEQVGKAHQAGLKVVPWTANTPEVWKKLVDAGVDAIITDDPAKLISFLKQ